jgi:cell division protein ZapE
MGTVQEEYQARVDAGTLHEEPVQRAALAALERVRAAVLNLPDAPKNGWFRKASPVVGPKGLYMWGGVGRGKSMLMELLYEPVEVP